MTLELLYFAWVREAIGTGREQADVPDNVATVAALIDWLKERGGGYAEALADPDRLRAALDQRLAPLDAPLAGTREVALFPPVTGG